MITSVRNPTIQRVRALQRDSRQRREERAFVVEGIRLLEEAVVAGSLPQLVLYSPDLSMRGRALLANLSASGREVVEVSPHALNAASDTQSPQGILAVFPLPEPAIPDPAGFTLVLDQLRDPGNLGTILRTASALGLEQIVLSPETADPFAPKSLRSGMGAQLRCRVAPLGWEQIRGFLEQSTGGQPVNTLLAAAGEGEPFTGVDFRGPTALIIGGEAEGASQEARLLARQTIHIPMPGGAESLNAAVAAGILLYEVARQRS
jgi:TrmH family RNA methyltransferase